MLILRRIKPKNCVTCSESFTKRRKEEVDSFKKRRTCCKECADILRNLSSKKVRCFCSKPTEAGGNFCSWEHRLIFIKCKQWGIMPTIKGYNDNHERLMKEQMNLERRLLDLEMAEERRSGYDRRNHYTEVVQVLLFGIKEET